MDKANIKEILIRLSKQDVFDGVGRLFIEEAKRDLNLTQDDIEKAIEEIKHEHEVRVHDNKILLITLQPRPKRPYTLRGKFNDE